MNKILIIVESPAKCSKIENYLGNDTYKCIASFGHIRELNTKKGLACINMDNFNVDFIQIKKQHKNILNIKKEIQNSKEVILATDDDREGEAIAWHICQVFKLPIKTTKRIIFHEITKSALKKAVDNPTYINMNKVQSQQTRQIIDLLVGFSISPLLWKYVKSGKPALSAGRCQTPALKLIFDNYEEIKKHPGEFKYIIYGIFNKQEFELNTKFDTLDEARNFIQKSITTKHIIQNQKIIQILKSPPKPFTTSLLQQKANSQLNFSPKQTMSICQRLYEEGYITYMRTDSSSYSCDFVKLATSYITDNYGKNYISKILHKITNNDNEEEINEDSENITAHEAIRICDISIIDIDINDKISVKEQKMYSFIRNNTIASCMSNSKYSKYISYINSHSNTKYKNTFEKQLFDGWEIIFDKNISNNLYDNFLSIHNDIINYEQIYTKYSCLKTKPHLNEANVVKLLEQKGIGRPSTFSSLVSKIQERNYVKLQDISGYNITATNLVLTNTENDINEIKDTKNIGCEKRKLVLTTIGSIVVDFLYKHCDNLFNYDYTAKMEENLDEILKQKIDKNTICKNIKKDIDSINIDEKVQFQIDDMHTFRLGKYGPMVQTEENGEKVFKPVKKDLNFDICKLKNGEYEIKDIIQTINENTDKYGNIILGKYKDHNIIIKNGKYGKYVSYDKINVSIKTLKEDEINYENIINLIENKKNPDKNNSNIIRIINHDIQLRKSKFGKYIYYKSKEMTKPRFIKITNTKDIDFENDTIDKIINWVDFQL